MSTFLNRKISDIEWLYINIHEMYNDFSIQIVLEGDGVFNIDTLTNAINVASQCNNFVRAKRVGKYWVDTGISPELIVYKGTFEEYVSMTTHNKYTIDLSKRVSVVYYFPQCGKLLFKVFHGVMDGRGVLNFVQNVFRVLCNKQEFIVPNSNINEKDFVQLLGGNGEKLNLKFNYSPPFNKFSFKSYDSVIKSIQIDLVEDSLVPIICKALHMTFVDSKVTKWMIPVDLRRHDKKLRCDSNLTLPIFLMISEVDNLLDIKGKYLFALKDKNELSPDNAKLIGISVLPRILIKCFLNGVKAIIYRKKKFPISGLVSFIEKSDLNNYSSPSFIATNLIALPCNQPFAPLTIMVTADSQKVNVVFGYYRDLWTENEENYFMNLFKTNYKNIING